MLTRHRLWFVDGDAGPSEVELLAVVECGPDGRILADTGFDPDDLDAGYAALDARYVELGSPTGNRAWRAMAASAAAQSRGDWPAVAEHHHPDFVQVDRRRMLELRPDTDASLEWLRLATSLGDVRHDCALVTTRGDNLAVTRSLFSFVDGEAGRSEVATVGLTECADDGRIVSSTMFESDQLDAALAALDARQAELAVDGADRDPATLTDWMENEAWRAQQRFQETSNRRDWESFRDLLDPDMVYSDLRPGIRLRVVGDELLDAYRPMFEFGDFRLDCELLATRGEDLALGRIQVWFEAGVAGPAEVETLSVIECGTDGRIVAISAFAADDMTGALDLLDARYVTRGGPDFAAMRRSFDARDWNAFATLLAPNCTIADHRVAGWGNVDRDTYVDYQRSVVELAPDARLWIDHTRSEGDVAISTGRAFGSQQGGSWEIAFATIGVAGPDGAAQHFENYELVDFDVARRRFGALVAERADAGATDPADFVDSFATRRNRAAIAVEQDGWTLLSVLDDDLCLHATPSGFVLDEVDASGATVARTEYAAGELRAAADEISRLVQRRTGTPDPAAQVLAAINAHDFNAMRACIDPSCVFEDHRHFRVVEFGDIDQHVESLRAGVDLAPDYTVLIRRVVAAEVWGKVVVTSSLGTTTDGSTFEIAVISLSAWNDTGRVSAMAIFEPNDLDAAIARLHALAP